MADFFRELPCLGITTPKANKVTVQRTKSSRSYRPHLWVPCDPAAEAEICTLCGAFFRRLTTPRRGLPRKPFPTRSRPTRQTDRDDEQRDQAIAAMIPRINVGKGVTGAVRYVLGEGRDPKTGELKPAAGDGQGRVAWIGGTGFGFEIEDRGGCRAGAPDHGI